MLTTAEVTVEEKDAGRPPSSAHLSRDRVRAPLDELRVEVEPAPRAAGLELAALNRSARMTLGAFLKGAGF